MKAELTLPPELVEQIANTVIERLKPILAGNSNNETRDRLLTPDELSEILKVKKPPLATV